MSVRKDKSLLQAALGVRRKIDSISNAITPYASVQGKFADLKRMADDMITLAKWAEGVEDETRETHLR